MNMRMTWMTNTRLICLSHGECARDDVKNVLANEKKRDNARSHSDIVEVSENGHVVIGVRIVQCYHAIMDVVIGVRIMQCYHAIMSNSEFPSHFWSQLSTCCQAV